MGYIKIEYVKSKKDKEKSRKEEGKKMDQSLIDDLILLARTRVSISTPDNPAPPRMAERAKEKLSWEA